jgi:hypothetical protein
LCGIEIETPINTSTITWDPSDITWLIEPSKASLPRYPTAGFEAGHPFNSDDDWIVCYFAEIPVPVFPSAGGSFSDTAVNVNYSFSEFTCGATHSGTLTVEEKRTWRVTDLTYIAIHYNTVTGAFDLSINVNMDLIYKATASIEWRRNGTLVATNPPFRPSGESQAANYRREWHQYTITTCADLFTQKSIEAQSPGTMTDFDDPALDVAWSGSSCNAIIVFTDLSRNGINSFILQALPVITAPTIDFTLIECT